SSKQPGLQRGPLERLVGGEAAMSLGEDGEAAFKPLAVGVVLAPREAVEEAPGAPGDRVILAGRGPAPVLKQVAAAAQTAVRPLERVVCVEQEPGRDEHGQLRVTVLLRAGHCSTPSPEPPPVWSVQPTSGMDLSPTQRTVATQFPYTGS